jgi:hypothetical protein
MTAVTKANAELADLADTPPRRPVGCWPTRNGCCEASADREGPARLDKGRFRCRQARYHPRHS